MGSIVPCLKKIANGTVWGKRKTKTVHNPAPQFVTHKIGQGVVLRWSRAQSPVVEPCLTKSRELAELAPRHEMS